MNREEKIEVLTKYIEMCNGHKEHQLDEFYIGRINLQIQAFELLLKLLQLPQRTIETFDKVLKLYKCMSEDIKQWEYKDDSNGWGEEEHKERLKYLEEIKPILDLLKQLGDNK